MKPLACLVCHEAAQGTRGWICDGCIRLLPQALIDRINDTLHAHAEAQRVAVAYLKHLRGEKAA